MDKRTRIMAIVFGLLVAYALGTSVVYPRWVEPLLTLDERIAKAQQELDVHLEREAKVDMAKRRFRRLAERSGSMDAGKVEIALRARLNELISEHGLKEAKVGAGRPSEDRKTGLSRLNITVDATATMESAVEFLRSLAELPQLVRVQRVDVKPITSARQKTVKDVQLGVTLTTLVLPQQKLVGLVKDEELKQPEEFLRHRDAEYALIWKRDPFNPYEAPKPPPVERPRNTEPPPPKTVVKESPRWKDASSMEFCMALLLGDGSTASDECMIYNDKTKDNQYVAVGQDFDGGKLLHVHPYGALVRREDGDFVYPLGAKLSQPIKVEQAEDFPELQRVHRRLPPPEPEGKAESAAPNGDVRTAAEVIGNEESAVDGAAPPAATEEASERTKPGVATPSRVRTNRSNPVRRSTPPRP